MKFLKKKLIQFIPFLALLVCYDLFFPLNLNRLKAVDRIDQLHASKLMRCMPPELQDLPYAIYPTSPEYNTARLVFNKRFVYFPKAMIAPRTFEEAQ